MTAQQKVETIGVILAGGKSRRMGVADKCLLPFEGKPLLDHVLARAKPQVDRVMLSTNGDIRRFTAFGAPVVEDIYPDHCGPLAGIISAMTLASKLQPQARWLACFPSDAPLAPRNWVAQLWERGSAQNLDVVVAADPQRAHYTFALWSMNCLVNLQQQFEDGERALRKVIERLHHDYVVCSSDPREFSNINTPADLRRLQER